MRKPETSGIGTRLRAARKRRGLSREALGYHSGISWSAIAQIESGRRRNVRPDTLSALSNALDVTLDYLVSGRPSSPPLLEHNDLIYDTDQELVETTGPFLAEGRERGEATLVVLNKHRNKLMRKHLGSAAEATEFIDAESWYNDPGAALNKYSAFSEEKLGNGAPWIRVVAELILEGRSDAEVRAWTRYESLVNLMFAAWPVSFICGYDRSSVDPEILRLAHAAHPHTLGRNGVTANPDYGDAAASFLHPH